MSLLPLQDIRSGSRIAFGVLNWGLGHATRSAVIIDELLSINARVIIGSDGIALEYLKNRYGNACQYVTLRDYGVRYRYHMATNMLLGLPKVLHAIHKEQKALKTLQAHEALDLIISDNRYGWHMPGVKSVMITHQLAFPLLPFVQRRMAQAVIGKWLQPFDEIWVPDFEDQRLSGGMSKAPKSLAAKCLFIGPLSLIKLSNHDQSGVTILLSGPEPARTELETHLLIVLNEFAESVRIYLIRGSTSPLMSTISPKVNIYHLASSQEVANCINQSTWVISRSGYSTIMDLSEYRGNILMIPTPGQPEQQYLAERMAMRSNMSWCPESEIGSRLRMILEELLAVRC